MVRVAAVQNAPRFGAVAENLAHVEELVSRAPADLYVLPELFATGYLFAGRDKVAAFAEVYPDGPICSFLARLSRQTQSVLAGGFAERTPEGRLCNAAALFDHGEPLGCYRKIHLFDRERRWFDEGDEPPRVFVSSAGRLGPLICFDWIFPEMARVLALDRAQILVHMANLVLPFAQDAMITRCLENGVFAITANRAGRDARRGATLSFTGRSQIVGTRGARLAAAAATGEQVIVTEIDPSQADEKALTAANHLFRDRRPDLYRGLLS